MKAEKAESLHLEGRRRRPLAGREEEPGISGSFVPPAAA